MLFRSLLGDSKKAIFGAGSDLQIYHDGSNSYVDDAGSGKLFLRGNTRVQIQKYTGEDMVTAIADGAVNLYYDNSKKLETTATGVAVTGGVALGGTGTANTLDDYEEGTFTPAWTSGMSTISYSTQLGKYTKIGNKVYLAIQIVTTAASATSGRMKLGGLPFTAQSTSAGNGVVGFVSSGLINSKSNNLPTFFCEPSALETYFTDGTQFLGTDVNNVASLNLHITATYMTDA